jgi:hypothetical protein
MFRSKYIISVLFFLCSTAFCVAQDSTRVSKDSSEDIAAASNYRVAADTLFIENNLTVAKDSISILKKEQGFEYADSLDSRLKAWQKTEAIKQPTQSNWLIDLLCSKITMYVLWGIAICFVVFLLYNLLLTQGVFRKRYARTKIATTPNKEEILTEADYDKLIAAAVLNKDYRLGVRYLYLQCLQLLITKGLVTPAADKTNYQYVQELYGKSYKNDFAALTLNYEYIWYGEFVIDETAYIRISNHFKQFKDQL